MSSALEGITKDYDGPRSTGTLWSIVEMRGWEEDTRAHDKGLKRMLRYHCNRVLSADAERAGYMWAKKHIWPQDVELMERIIKEVCFGHPFLMFDHLNDKRPKIYKFCYGIHRRIMEIYDGLF